MTSITASGPGPVPWARQGRYDVAPPARLPGRGTTRGHRPLTRPGPAPAARPGPAWAATSASGREDDRSAREGSRSAEGTASAVPGAVHGAVPGALPSAVPAAGRRSAPGAHRNRPGGCRYDIVPPTRRLPAAATADLNSALVEQGGPYTGAAVNDGRALLAALEAGRSEPVTELPSRSAVGMTDGTSLMQMSTTGHTPASGDDAAAPLKTGRELAAAMLAKGVDGLMGERAL